MQKHFIRLTAATIVICAVTSLHAATPEPEALQLHSRSRVADKDPGGEKKHSAAAEKTVTWQPKKTALIICDMWDDHWCRGAARRVTELAEPVNKLAHRARDMGVLVIHAPSTCVDFYKDTPQRRRAQAAPYAKPPVPLSQATRWGTHWCWPDPKREPELPIDDSDMGCDCETKCEIASPWKRQIALIDIEEPDAISDDGQEVFNLLEQRGINQVLIAGVHLNMCVLGRSFAIRQMVTLGKQVMLVRDLTDTMYCSRMKPFVNHFEGTDLVIEHIERHWCPTVTSVDLLGGSAFRFREDTRK
jgi:nicotinamidase-related amidase